MSQKYNERRFQNSHVRSLFISKSSVLNFYLQYPWMSYKFRSPTTVPHPSPWRWRTTSIGTSLLLLVYSIMTMLPLVGVTRMMGWFEGKKR